MDWKVPAFQDSLLPDSTLFTTNKNRCFEIITVFSNVASESQLNFSTILWHVSLPHLSSCPVWIEASRWPEFFPANLWLYKDNNIPDNLSSPHLYSVWSQTYYPRKLYPRMAEDMLSAFYYTYMYNITDFPKALWEAIANHITFKNAQPKVRFRFRKSHRQKIHIKWYHSQNVCNFLSTFWQSPSLLILSGISLPSKRKRCCDGRSWLNHPVHVLISTLLFSPLPHSQDTCCLVPGALQELVESAVQAVLIFFSFTQSEDAGGSISTDRSS